MCPNKCQIIKESNYDACKPSETNGAIIATIGISNRGELFKVNSACLCERSTQDLRKSIFEIS